MSEKEQESVIERACSMGIFEQLADEYISFCYTSYEEEKEKESDEEKNGEKKSKRGTSKKKSSEESTRFPNLAGFCRYFGIGQTRYDELRRKYPEEFEKLSFILEDEALNSKVSASLLGAYLKKRLGYGDSSPTAEATSEVEAGQLKLIFEHDILRDGE